MPTQEEVDDAANDGRSGKPRQLFYKHLHYKNGMPRFDSPISKVSSLDKNYKKEDVPNRVVFFAGNGMRTVDEVWLKKESNGDGDFWFEKE